MRTLVLGLGNELAGDDAVGVLVARAVRDGSKALRTWWRARPRSSR